ncbi:MAG: sigma-70 family RNA polymerase sigma factor [Gemmataceae bacterium]|nr:sigma-70 family RNA polymerase sigma factor [Gemmataceae bacterium]
MPEPSDDRSLVEQWRAGDQKAAQKLFDNYVDRLVPLARRRISQRLASRVDPEDVVQSVFRTFFGGVKQGRFHIKDQDDLYKLLMRITVHKTLRHIAFHKAAKRDPSQEAGQGEEAQDRLIQLLDREPTPEDAVTFLDQLEHFLSRLRPQERQILEMRLQGYSNEDIAEKLGIYDRKIRRVFERVRGLAEREGLAP